MSDERIIRLKFKREHYPITYGGPQKVKWENTEPAPPVDWKDDIDEMLEMLGGNQENWDDRDFDRVAQLRRKYGC